MRAHRKRAKASETQPAPDENGAAKEVSPRGEGGMEGRGRGEVPARALICWGKVSL